MEGMWEARGEEQGVGGRRCEGVAKGLGGRCWGRARGVGGGRGLGLFWGVADWGLTARGDLTGGSGPAVAAEG